MGDIYDDDEEPVIRPKKKSIFSKEARVTLSEGAKAIDFFSRGRDNFERTLEEEKRKQERRLAKLERKRSSKSVEPKEKSPVEEKRRKVSAQKYVDTGYSSGEGSHNGRGRESPLPRRRESSHTSHGSPKSSYKDQKSQNSPTSPSARYKRDLNVREPELPKQVKGYISLSDSDDNDDGGVGKRIRKSTIPVRKPAANPTSLFEDDDDFYILPPKTVPPPDDDDLQLSEEEFPEFVQAAREREKLKAKQRLEAAAKASKKTSDGGVDTFDDLFDSPKAQADPIVEILITSKMAGTKPIMVKRKLSQRLKEAKHGWCDKQSLPEHSQDSLRAAIFLTWKTYKLHDATTCRSLGVSLADDGQLSYDADGMDGEGRIHLQAWTESAYEIYQSREAEKERKEQALKEGKVEPAPPEVKTRLILKAKGMEDFKLNVKPTTSIQKIVGAFQRAREDNIPEGKTVSLYFDGDKLDPESIVEETELSDMDTVEVHFR